MIVPSVRIVIGNNNRRVLPLRLRFEKVDRVDDEVLLIERVGVAGMSVLVAGRLEKTHCGKVAHIDSIEKVMSVILMIGHVAVGPNRHHRAWPRMLRVRGRLVILKRLVVRDVVGFLYIRDCRGGAAQASSGSIFVGYGEVKPAFEKSPAYTCRG